MDLLIKNMELPLEERIQLSIYPNGLVVNHSTLKIEKNRTTAIELSEHGRLVSAEDFIDSFEDIINECRRQLSEKGEDLTVLNYFHDTIVELMGYMPTVLEANNGTDN